MAKARVLALDGGGIRGVFTGTILDRLESALPGFLAKVDLFAGTSTGGILALGLASGQTPRQLADLYVQKGKAIFDDSWLDDLRDLGGLSGAEYDNKNLKAALAATFGTRRLKDLSPRRVLVGAFDLDNEDPDPKKHQWKPKFFHNYPGSDSDGGELVVDVALRTSAAPTKFPSYQGYVDGGVVANNPSMAALAQALDARSGAPAKLAEVTLLSLGTGTSLQYVAGQSHDWGYAQWAKPLIALILDGIVGVADFQCQQLLGGRYHRLAPKFPPDVAIGDDDVERIPDLLALAKAQELGPTLEWLEERW